MASHFDAVGFGGADTVQARGHWVAVTPLGTPARRGLAESGSFPCHIHVMFGA